MDRLPLEIKTSICSYRGLRGFSAANRHCNQAAQAILFARIHISLTTPEALQTYVTDTLDVLMRGKSDVRTLQLE